MIKRLYIDNFKCFSNFELQFSKIQLLLGENGTGKSAIFDVLNRLGGYSALGATTATAFHSSFLRVMEKSPRQIFEIEILEEEFSFVYRVIVDHSELRNQARTVEETLKVDDFLLYHFDGLNAEVSAGAEVGKFKFPMDGTVSGLANLPDREDLRMIQMFKARMSSLYCFNVNPSAMQAETKRETLRPARDLHDFASWVRALTQSSFDVLRLAYDDLSIVIPGFQSLALRPDAAETKYLVARFSGGADKQAPERSNYELNFEDLSDGQRCLIAYYTLQHCVHGSQIFCIDEPDNYISIRELQPWLLGLIDRVEGSKAQLLLISHHPEFIDRLAYDHGIWLQRDHVGPVRAVRPSWEKGDKSLSASELIARGWVD